MFLRMLPVLGVLLLAACTSSEPQNASPVPLAPGAAASLPASALPPSDQTVQQTDDAAGATAPQPASDCRAVGNATLCDAIPDPYAEDRLYTN